jgi:hypothetical protein
MAVPKPPADSLAQPSLADYLAETELSALSKSPEAELSALSKSPEAELSALSQEGHRLARQGAKQLSALSQLSTAELSALGEELLEPRALLSALSSEPGAGPRALSCLPGRLLSALSKRQARQAGKKGGLARVRKQTPEQRREIAMLGVAGRRNP